jgi:hypothetical protein
LVLGKCFKPFFVRSQFIPGGHKTFGIMAGCAVNLPPLNLRRALKRSLYTTTTTSAATRKLSYRTASLWPAIAGVIG